MLVGHQNGQTQRLKTLNLSICVAVYRGTKAYRYYFLKAKVFSYQRQVKTWRKRHLRLNHVEKKPLMC